MYISTPRLILREWQDNDFLPFSAINQDREVMRYAPRLLREEDTKILIKFIQQHFRTYGFGLYAVTLKECRTLAGYCGIYRPLFKAHFMPSISIGWRLAYKYWGKGYAWESASAVLLEAFVTHEIPEIVAFCVDANIRSQNLMCKLGMVRDIEGDFMHPDFEVVAYKKHVLYRLNREKFLKWSS